MSALWDPCVDRRLLDALDVRDLASFDPRPGWQRRAGDEVLRIPAGAPVGASDSVVTIELSARSSVVLCAWDCPAELLPRMLFGLKATCHD